LSRTIQVKLEHIFQLSRELAAIGHGQAPLAQADSDGEIPRKKKSAERRK
jgi:hypothetical protein